LIVIGITGSFGGGKSTVAKILASYGVKIIDSDKIVHRILKSNSKICKKIIKVFGDKILNTNFTKIDRAKLGKIVFQNRIALRKLCKIIHPEVVKKIEKQLARIKKESIVAIEAPLLIEAGLLDLVDSLIVVKTNRRNQIQRIKNKMKLSSTDIIKRIKAQLPIKEKIKFADYVIDNNKDISYTKRQVKEIYSRLLK
jgi:dephospho-CoA kinase